ncbi:inner centromere protein isoform X2 [Corvus hawaiiensis]|uniref:inner centromere protein isoform X2 n=1 Tax=Corvus hawaiiensis TaxID=134902 RepID=UPI0020194D95|nr:inner centromere protein isoform X2 [Corvus hawaiiensis]
MAAKVAAAAMGPAAAAARSLELPAECDRRLAQFLQHVDETDMVWLDEIYEEAVRMFVSNYSEELELMPKTPSQKKRQRRKRLSALQEEEQEPGRKRLSRRRNSSLKLVPSVRASQRLRNKENLELSRTEAKESSPPQRVTRSRAAASASSSKVVPETPPPQQAAGKDKDPCVEADHIGATVPLRRSGTEPAELLPTSSGNGSPEEHGAPTSPLVPMAPELAVPCTPEARQAVPELQTAKAANVTITLSMEAGLEEGDGSLQEHGHTEEPCQPPRDSPGTPTGARLSRRSVRRSLMGKASLSRRTSLAEKYSLASKRESMIRTSIARAAGRKKAARKRSVSCSSVDVSSSVSVPEDEETVVKAGPPPGSSTPSKLDCQSPRMSLRSHTVSKHGQPQEPSSSENNLNKNGGTLDPPQSARRKPSYKRAVDERYDHQQAEEGGLSPLRRKTPSPVLPASRVVRPFKTFLHTVQKNQLLMTPSSVGRTGVIKSFIRYNTPVQADPKEKERQKLETLRKKQEAEQLRRQKLEEEKKRRLGEAKLKREERLRKVLQARERAEEMEKERKRRIKEKIALFDEKTEKVREERLAEEKIKKRVAARKMEEAEARRRQEEEARRQRALQQAEEEERRHRELMQKKREEEQERAQKIAEQRQAEQEQERQLAAERELERKREQERIQAEKLREQQEKAARLQKEAADAKERLRREMEKKEEQQMLAEKKRQEEEQKKLLEEQKAKDSAQALLLENKENSPACNSYEMTPQNRKEFKLPVTSSNDYGMDLNSDDSTDDESQPRKPVPAWATGHQLSQAVIRQYYNPPDVDALFGAIPSPRLEHIFYKSKPRYFKRTSSAVWHSPPTVGAKPALGLPCGLKKP